MAVWVKKLALQPCGLGFNTLWYWIDQYLLSEFALWKLCGKKLVVYVCVCAFVCVSN